MTNMEQIAREQEGILTMGVLLATTGAALVNSNLYAGLTCIAGSVALFFVRYKFKSNGRWQI